MYLPGSAEDDQLRAIITSGCKLEESNYNLVLLDAGEQIAWTKLRDQLQPKVVLLFNVSPAQLGISALFRINEINNFDNVRWVPTISLDRLIQDKEFKSNLWNNALKPLFVNKIHGEIV